MFGDVIQIITTHAIEDHCGSEQIPEEFCSDHIAPMFIKMFAVLIGDFDLNEFKYSSGIEIVFLIFALLGALL